MAAKFLENVRRYSNAPSVNKLEGLGASAGIGATIQPPTPFSVLMGLQYDNIPDSKNNTSYHGVTWSQGIGTPGAGLDGYVSVSNTTSGGTINVFDNFDSFYEKARKWLW